MPRAVSVAVMQQIDQVALTEFAIPRLILMEHAGLAVSRHAQGLVPETGRSVVICCGPGHNGGDGLCAARHLHQAGMEPRVLLVGALDRLKDVSAIEATMLQRLKIPIRQVRCADDLASVDAWFESCDLIIDALLGIGLVGPVHAPYDRLIERINRVRVPVLAVDVPSGLNADIGIPQPLAVRATVTVTMGLAKQGFFVGEGPAYVGRLVVEPIGFPRELLGRFGAQHADSR